MAHEVQDQNLQDELNGWEETEEHLYQKQWTKAKFINQSSENHLTTLILQKFPHFDLTGYCIALQQIDCVLYFVNNTCIKAIILKLWRSESIFEKSLSLNFDHGC